MTRTTRILAAAAALAMLPTTAIAAPGGKGGGGKDGGSSSVVVADGVYGQTTTAIVADPRPGTWIVAECHQAGRSVIFWRDEVDSSGAAVIPLGPTEGYTAGVGGADCVADVKYWNLKRQRWVPVGSTTFRVTDSVS